MRITSAKTLINAQSGLKFTKHPRWFRQKLWFLDVHDRCVKSADMQGRLETVMNLPYVPGNFEVLADGGLIVGNAWHRKICRFERAGPIQIADLSNLVRSCLSGSIIDGRGGMYVGDVGFNFLDPLVDPVPGGAIVYINADSKLSLVAGDLFFPSGMVLTPDNKTLIVAEMLPHRLTAFDIETDGALRNRRVWAALHNEIKPDGICLDSDSAIWVAGTCTGALRVREGGEIDRQITTIRPVFATMLGGPERRHLFMCTSDSNDPVITRQVAGATIDIAEVETPGLPHKSLMVADLK